MDPIMIGEMLAALMFFGVIGFLLLGFPVAFTLAGTSLLFCGVGMALGVFDPSDRPRCVGVAWSFGAIERGRAFTAVASTRRVAWRPWCVHRSRPPRFGECASVGPKSLI